MTKHLLSLNDQIENWKKRLPTPNGSYWLRATALNGLAWGACVSYSGNVVSYFYGFDCFSGEGSIVLMQDISFLMWWFFIGLSVGLVGSAGTVLQPSCALVVMWLAKRVFRRQRVFAKIETWHPQDLQIPLGLLGIAWFGFGALMVTLTLSHDYNATRFVAWRDHAKQECAKIGA